MPDNRVRIALVTGGNRGIGFEVCRQLASQGFIVLLTARSSVKARAAARKLAGIGRVEPLLLNVADALSIKKAAAEVSRRYGYLDVLISGASVKRFCRSFGRVGQAESLTSPRNQDRSPTWALVRLPIRSRRLPSMP